VNHFFVFRHLACEGPGYLGELRSGRGMPSRLVCIDRGEAVPESPEGAAGLVFMGGPMSVNDPLPWVDRSGRSSGPRTGGALWGAGPPPWLRS
jgi:GMP synthase-like glutamine amidotransferase